MPDSEHTTDTKHNKSGFTFTQHAKNNSCGTMQVRKPSMVNALECQRIQQNDTLCSQRG